MRRDVLCRHALILDSGQRCSQCLAAGPLATQLAASCRIQQRRQLSVLQLSAPRAQRILGAFGSACAPILA